MNGAADDIEVASVSVPIEEIQRISPSIVRIETAGGTEVRAGLSASAPATGVVVGADGWIISSTFNLSHRPSGIVVTLADGTKHAARIVAEDRSRLLVLLKIDSENLPVPEAVPPEEIVVGKSAFALGKSWDPVHASVSAGIISATNRIWGRAIQTDANVSPVNYGGPLIDLQGRVFGIITPLSLENGTAAGVAWYDSGIGFAAPFHDVLRKLPELKKGDLAPGLVGIQTDSTDLFSPPKIAHIWWRTPAATAGMQAGDLILSVNGKPTRWLGEFRHAVGPLYAGEQASVRFRRETQELEQTLTLIGEIPRYRWPVLGMQLLPAGAEESGLPIGHVLASSAAEASLKPGDRLLSVNGKEVENLADVDARFLEMAVDEEVTVIVEQEGEEKSLSLRARAFPETFSEEPDNAIKFSKKTQTLPTGMKWWLAEEEISQADSEQSLPPLVVLCFTGSEGPKLEELAEGWQAGVPNRRLLLAGCEAGPKAELAVMKDVFKHLQETSNLAPKQVVACGFADGCPNAAFFVRANKGQVRGLILAQPLPINMERMQPESALAIFYSIADKESSTLELRQSVDRLKELGYPVTIASDPMPVSPFTRQQASTLSAWLRQLSSL